MPLRPVLAGTAFEVCAYARNEDSCQVVAHLDGLGDRDRKRVAALLKRMADQGPPHNYEQCRKVAGEGFWELKAYQQRVFWCYDPRKRRRIILLRGFVKKSVQTPKKELAAGRQAYREAQQEPTSFEGEENDRELDSPV